MPKWISMSDNEYINGRLCTYVFECEDEEADTVAKVAAIKGYHRIVVHERKPSYNEKYFTTAYFNREVCPDWYPVKEEDA